MRNLLLFIIRNHPFFLFAGIEMLCFILIYQHNHYHRSFFIHSANAVVGNIYNTTSDIQDYFRLRVVNDSLLTENARLHGKTYNRPGFMEMQPEGYMGRHSFFLTEQGHRAAHTDTSWEYRVRSAKVIRNATGRLNNYLTLDRGARHGIAPKMAVVAPQGVVGVVKHVSSHFSTVISVLHTDLRVSAKILPSGHFGTLSWDGGNTEYVLLHDIPRHLRIRQGDKVVTSGYSAIFPEHIIIGTVADYEIEPGTGFYAIRVRLAAEMRRLDYVYVIEYALKEERTQLEAKANDG